MPRFIHHSPPNYCRIACALLASCGLGLVSSCAPRIDTPATAGVESPSLLEELLELDTDLVGPGASRAALQAARDSRVLLQACRERDDLRTRRRCALDALVGPAGMQPVNSASSPMHNTATFALTNGKGSCAALVAAVLALTENTDLSFDAAVLREHVLLGSTEPPEIYFEVLEGGRRLGAGDLAQHRPDPPMGPIKVNGREYLAYYVDNIAARLADAGDRDGAERAFEEALRRSPGAARIHYNYGTFLIQGTRYELALEHLDKAISLGWRNSDAFVNRGVTRWKLGNLKTAGKDFERALALDPRNRRAAANLRLLAESDP